MTTDRRARFTLCVVILAAVMAGCGGATRREAALVEGGAPPPTLAPAMVETTTSAAPTTTVTPAPTSAAPKTSVTTAAPASELAPAAAPSPSRKVFQQAWTPFATVEGLVLRHPSSRVETIGFHQSNLDGARQLDPLPTSAPTALLADRGRDTPRRTAADVLVDPDVEIRAPVTGTVLYSGTYVLYCEYSDDFLVIEPDDHPGWEVKVLHIDRVQVRPGARVQAGQTVIAPRATRLPFPSDVEELSADPVWPHVHIEVDDPNIPDRPTGPGC